MTTFVQFGTPWVLQASGVGGPVFSPGGGSAWADDTAWMAAALDLSQTPATEYVVDASVETGATPPAAGRAYHFYAAFGSSPTDFAHTGITGSAGQFASGEEQEHIAGLIRLGELFVTNDASTVITRQLGILIPRNRYLVGVGWNKSGQDGADSTNFRLTLTPRYGG